MWCMCTYNNAVVDGDIVRGPLLLTGAGVMFMTVLSVWCSSSAGVSGIEARILPIV